MSERDYWKSLKEIVGRDNLEWVPSPQSYPVPLFGLVFPYLRHCIRIQSLIAGNVHRRRQQLQQYRHHHRPIIVIIIIIILPPVVLTLGVLPRQLCGPGHHRCSPRGPAEEGAIPALPDNMSKDNY
jgi:hypothetical protein